MKKEFLDEQQVRLRELSSGEFFTLNDPNHAEQVDERLVWVRGEYDRATKSYYCYKYADVNHERPMKGTRKVWGGFCF